MLAWIILAKPTREITTRLNVLAMPELLAARYYSPNLKTAAAMIIFLFLVPYSASVYMGLSYLFEQIFNIPYTYALIFIAALTGIYLVMGGYLAVTLTDFIQGLVMIVGAVLKPAMVVSTAFAFIIAFGAYFTGSFGRLFFNKATTAALRSDEI